MRQDAEHVSLSMRQSEIAQLVVSGRSTREIALALTLSPRTVETHIAAIYSKYGVSSRAELIFASLGPGGRLAGNAAAAEYAASTNLPARRASLLGRATEVAKMVSLMRESRLVTVTGAGGVGKTQVALAVGAAVLEQFKGGVWLVELAPLARGSSVGEALARALSIELSPSVPPLESLRAHLKQKSLVIILDNCEHLVAEASTVVDALLRDCPQVRMLATSREPLRIAGERTYRLPSLRVPSANDMPALDAVRGAAYPSIDLFMQRAQAVAYDFSLNDENIASVAEICRRVDGIPLAIELAAARVNILPVWALAAQLESHLRILGIGDRTALPRHQTMHALIDWSYDLLEPAEQYLFERLSIFAGSCALPEAVAVCGDATVDEVGVLDTLSSLVDKSLVVADPTGLQPRYGLLQTFAQYAMEKLAARGEAELAARLHVAAYVRLAERLEAEYDAAPSMSWLARSEREIGNWRAALVWSLEERHDVVLGQRLVAAMRPVWLNAEGAHRWLQLARDLIDEKTPPTVAAAVYYATAYVNFDYGDLDQTVTDCRELRKTYERLGNPHRVTYLQTWEGTALFLLGRVAEAQPLLVHALETAREQGWSSLIAYLLAVGAQLNFIRGDAPDGRAKHAEAIAIYESIGADKSAAIGQLNLAEAEFGCGNIEAAVELATSGLIAVRRIGLKTSIAMGLINLAGYCIAADRWTAAYDHAREAVMIMKDMQQHLFFLVALQHVAAIAALAPSEAGGAQQGQRAAQLLGFTDACFVRFGYARESNEQREYDRVLAALRAACSEEHLPTHLAEGAAITPDQAVEIAMLMQRSDRPG